MGAVLVPIAVAGTDGYAGSLGVSIHLYINVFTSVAWIMAASFRTVQTACDVGPDWIVRRLGQSWFYSGHAGRECRQGIAVVLSVSYLDRDPGNADAS